MIINKEISSKMGMNLQLFAEKGETVESTEPQGNEGFVYDPNFFTETTEDERPAWLKDDGEEETEEVESEEETKDETPEDIKQQSKEANSAFADMRRQKKDLEQKAKEDDEWVERNYGYLDLHNMKDYRNSMDSQTSERDKEEIEESGMDMDLIHKAMRQDPQLKALLESQPKQAEKQTEETTKAEEARIEAENEKLYVDYDALVEKYPEFVTKPEDITQEVWDLYEKGIDLTKAFKLINEDIVGQKATKKNKEITRQETLNKLNSKKHLKTEKDSSGAAKDLYVSKEKMSVYKSMGISEKQAIQFEKSMLNK